MAKKKNNRNGDKDISLQFVPNEVTSMMDSPEGMMLQAVHMLYSMGVTPEEYKNLYNLFSVSSELIENGKVNSPEELMGYLMGSEENGELHRPSFELMRGGQPMQHKTLQNAVGKTLYLRVQLKHIKKPPVWREVEVPADYDFEELHRVIQTLFGWYNSHLWEFVDNSYPDGLHISCPNDDDMFDELGGICLNAYETNIADFLTEPGDKMCYVYDFGDWWEHDITVKKVLDRPSAYPVCVKGKGDGGMEDCGGPWGYTEKRNLAEALDNEKNPENREKMLAESGFDDEETFASFFNPPPFSLSDINKSLQAVFSSKPEGELLQTDCVTKVYIIKT